MKTISKFFAIFVVLTLIVFSIFQIRNLNIATAGETCPHTGEWTKIDSGDLTIYPVTGATEYCFKAGNYSPVSQIPSGGFGQSGSCNNGIQYCDLSHWSYRITSSQPSPAPTDIPEATPTPTDEPSITPTPTNTPEVSPTPSTEPTVTPTPTNIPDQCNYDCDEVEITPTPTQDPEATPTVTPTPTIIQPQLGGGPDTNDDSGSSDDSNESDDNSDDSASSDSSATKAILATNTFSANSGASVLAATGGFVNTLMNSMALSGFGTFLLGIYYHVKKEQEK